MQPHPVLPADSHCPERLKEKGFNFFCCSCASGGAAQTQMSHLTTPLQSLQDEVTFSLRGGYRFAFSLFFFYIDTLIMSSFKPERLSNNALIKLCPPATLIC